MKVVPVLTLIFFIETSRANHSDCTRRLKTILPDFVPEGVIDIGANRGDWSKEIHELYPEASILMLEASNQHVETLADVVKGIGASQSEFKIAIMTDQVGQKIEWYEQTGNANTGNSIFKENTHHFANAKAIERISSTVDTEVAKSILTRHNKHVDLIKVDVQGAELLVLEGAQKTLSQATFIQFEASVVN